MEFKQIIDYVDFQNKQNNCSISKGLTEHIWVKRSERILRSFVDASLKVVWQPEDIAAKVAEKLCLLLVLSQKIIGSNAPTQAS